MKPKIEKRLFKINAETRADETGVERRVLIGMPIVYESRSENFGSRGDSFYEIIKRGSATKALKKSDVRALYDHGGNGTLPLGRESASTLQLRENAKGVESIIFLPDTTFAKDLLISVDRGDLREMSFAFTVAKKGDTYEMRDGEEWRIIHEFDELFDVSVVPFAAYPDTTVAVEARDKWKAEIDANNKKAHDDERRNLEIDLLSL